MTFKEAKEKFVGSAIVSATPEWYRHCNYEPDEECRGDCSKCEACSKCLLTLWVSDVHATRRSFLLECDDIGTTVVVSKDQAANFELCSAKLSPELEEQVYNLGLELDEEKFLFCRTWQGKSHRYWGERIFVYPCEREKANCLIVVNRIDCAGMFMSHMDEERCGGQGKRLQSHSLGDGTLGNIALDFWRFQYDPEADKLVVPAEKLDQSIDEMIEKMA